MNGLMAGHAGPATTGAGSAGVTAAELTAAFNAGLLGNGDYRVCVPQSSGGGAPTSG